MELLVRFHSEGGLLTLPANITLGVTNALAYNIAITTAIKGSIIQALGLPILQTQILISFFPKF